MVAHGGAPLQRPAHSLGSIIAGFKSASTRRINQVRQAPGEPVWQRNYYEHIIRSERALNRIRVYIQANPARWAEDV
jgi:REP element-mobilizing transposase RayT